MEMLPLIIITSISAFVLFIGIYSWWKIFRKAGRPGWYAIIPFFNIYIYLKIAGMSGWTMFLLIIPIISLLPMIYLQHRIAKNFGKGVGFSLGLILIPIIFVPVLAFDDSVYRPIE